MSSDLLKIVRATRYPLEAFVFVQRGLDHTVRQMHGEPVSEDDTTNRHVSGQQLCQGLREFALQQYGLMARSVLRHWGINSSADFGHIVFAMVEGGMMQKTDHDDIRDFHDVYDFAEAFAASLELSENNNG